MHSTNIIHPKCRRIKKSEVPNGGNEHHGPTNTQVNVQSTYFVAVSNNNKNLHQFGVFYLNYKLKKSHQI